MARFRFEQARLGLYSVATAFATPTLIALGMANQSATSIALSVVGIVAFGWISVIAK